MRMCYYYIGDSMAYIKYKELTKYFNFRKQIDINELPKYVTDYVDKDETVIAAYRTSRDKGIFTNRRMILFDIPPLSVTKKIHIVPYASISSAAVSFKASEGAIFLSMDSGYQIRLNFVNLKAEDKTQLRLLFSRIMEGK